MVLGPGFKEYYNIGDTIPIAYLREKFNGKVVYNLDYTVLRGY